MFVYLIGVLKGRVALLAKITLPIKFAILINDIIMKNSKTFKKNLDYKFVTFCDQISNPSSRPRELIANAVWFPQQQIVNPKWLPGQLFTNPKL